MIKRMTALACVLACSFSAYAQEVTTEAKERKLEHHIGVQANELIRQVFNFNNNNNNTVTNPYLLTYNINMKKTGWGLRVGAGYNKRSISNDDGVVKSNTESNKVNARLGVEKAFQLSGRWTTGVGLDGVYANDDNNTTTITRTADSTTTKLKSTISSYGGGAMAWLRYSITPNVVIGTEMSFYYTEGKQKQDLTITRRSNSLPGGPFTTTTSKIDSDKSEGIFSLPVVLYIYVRF